MASDSGTTDKISRRPECIRLRDLKHRIKVATRLSAVEEARLEIEAHESQVEVLLSVHKEPSRPFAWHVLAASLAPAPPQRQFHREQRVRQCALLAEAGLPSYEPFRDPAMAELAAARDEEEFQEAVAQHQIAKTEAERKRDLAHRVLLRDESAFAQALLEFNPLTDLDDMVVDAHF